jgi:nucleolar pre-ribosomal-associated protein 2
MAPKDPVRAPKPPQHVALTNLPKTAQNGPAPTRPRLQAISQNFSDLNEQISQAANIIGLPNDWASIQEEDARSFITARLVRARAEWVLRWALDKLKDEADAGRTARGNASLWKLLDWMLHSLPISRSAPHLRDASFPTILQRSLVENFDQDLHGQPAPASEDVEMTLAPESSQTVAEGTSPSRKRKRRGLDTDSPSKKVALDTAELGALFLAIRNAIHSITGLAAVRTTTQDTTQAELMKVVLRTDSAQASSILKLWLTSVRKLTAIATPDMHVIDEYLDMSLVTDIWELRTVASSDETGSSAEEFGTECLVPALMLLDALKNMRKSGFEYPSASVVERTTQALEKLVARHLFAPSRAAFFADANKEPTEGASKYREAKLLSSSLEPLRAKLLQVAQIEDENQPIPADLASLSGAMSYLLSLVIRVSPSRTPRSRLAEKPWIQAVFVSLAECAGCSLTAPPEFVTSKSNVEVLEQALGVLRQHDVSIKPEILKDLFWYHTGVKYPKNQEKEVRWSLIAALIELDPTVFVTEPKAVSGASREQRTDLAEFIFEQITTAEFKGPGFADDESSNAVANREKSKASRKLILERIIIPMMSASARNRHLLGFIRRWDDQLIKTHRYENRKALKDCKNPIWEDRELNKSLAELFEQTLTQSQIAKLIQEHAKRIDELEDALKVESEEDVNVRKLAAYKRAASSAVILSAVLQSIRSDDIIGALKPHLASLFRSYSSWVQEDRYSLHSRLALSWLTLCQLLSKLWPIELHGSSQMQTELLHPLVEQATNDMSGRKDQNVRPLDSSSRSAAMLFLLDACDCLRTLPGSKQLIQDSIRKALDGLSSNRFDPNEHLRMIEFICVDFVQLFGHLDSEVCEKSLLNLLAKISQFDAETGSYISHSLSQTIFEQGNSVLQNTYSAALLEVLEKESAGGNHNVALNSLIHLRPAALSREKREAILDKLVTLLGSGLRDATGLLSIMVQLMETPNSTAKISSDGTVIFGIAEQLQKQGLESPTSLQQLRQLAQLTLGHVITNQNQAQNMTFLGQYKGQLDSLMKKGKNCSASGLAVLRATFAVQKQNLLLQPKQYIAVLKNCLAQDSSEAASLHDVLDAFNELPITLLDEAKQLDSTQVWLLKWVNENADLESYLVTGGQGPAELAEYVARLHTLVARFKIYPSTEWLINLTLKVLREPVGDRTKMAAMETLKQTLVQLPIVERLDLVSVFTNAQDPLDTAASYRLLNTLISTFEDRYDADASLKQRQLSLLPSLCTLLGTSRDHASFNALLDSINTILKDKPALASQHGIEATLTALVKLTTRSSPALSPTHATAIYSRLAETTRLILLLHRGRLGGRYHIVLPLLQGLLFCLFVPNTGRGPLPAWLKSTPADTVRLTPANGAQYARLVATLCNPPQSSIQKTAQHARKSKELNDPVRAAREKASMFLYPLLASYCRFQLAGRLEPAVRDKVMPGIWEVVGTASLSRDTLDAMFGGLGRSERDVWRGVWGEWESVYGRKGVLVGEGI